ncbi:NAD-dependent formate dehydrogenase gamma subunit [Rubellimicrobium mesophilum DSM 19309]|uniref:NAD-dependent formate dehydrogenase gamma subunit n=1 Tax=Rubellimicrobium mesophilum DSM 19309 TaxID=442562 RepID=A0A017HQ37_9RHOB|nr:NAD(P)H-dependent oxidoreductase subunit E [Rubellimicrobium mesophilum]EYD76288.1 NAD-dependent formate dehydrogenase gamma subunit [Rubellimicrobium mesophilum DSM 19309]
MLDTADFAARLREIIDAHLGLEGPLLPILHAVQHEWGHIPEPAIPQIAAALNLGRAEVHGVVSFYHDFRREPAGKLVLKLCAAEACQAQGGRDLARDVLKGLGLTDFGTTPDGKVTVERTFCLGLCACGPSAMVGDRPVAAAKAEDICREALA